MANSKDQDLLIKNIVRQIDEVTNQAIAKADKRLAELANPDETSLPEGVDWRSLNVVKKIKESRQNIKNLKKTFEYLVETGNITDKTLHFLSKEITELAKDYNLTLKTYENAEQKAAKTQSSKGPGEKELQKSFSTLETSQRRFNQTIKKTETSVTQKQADAIQARANSGPKRNSKAIKGNNYQFVSPLSVPGSKNKGQNGGIIDIDPSKLAFFDTETIGEMDGKNFGITQLSVRVGDKTKSAFIKLKKDQEAYLKGLMQRVAKNESLNDDEQRDLLSFANIIEEINETGEKIVSVGNYNVPKGTKVTAKNKDLLDRISKGIEIMSGTAGKGGAANFYSDTNSAYSSIMPKNFTFAGHNISGPKGFDLNALSLSGVKKLPKENKVVDTLGIARQFLKIGSKRQESEGDVRTLTGYSLDNLAKFFNIKVDETKRHTAEFDTLLNQQILAAMQKYIIDNKISSDVVTVKSGAIGRAGRSYFRDETDTKSFKTDGKGSIVSAKDFGNQLFKNGESYKFNGITGTGADRYAKFTGVGNGEEVFISAENENQIQAILSGVFNGEFADQVDPKALAQEVVGNLARSGKGFYEASNIVNSKGTDKDSGFYQARREAIGGENSETYKMLSTLVKDITALDATADEKEIIFSQSLKKMGAKKGVEFNPTNIGKMVTENAKKTFVSMRKAYLDFVKEYQRELGAGEEGKKNRKELEEAILSVEAVSDDKIAAGENPFFEVNRLLQEKLDTQATRIMKKFPKTEGMSVPKQYGEDYESYIHDVVTHVSTKTKETKITPSTIAEKLASEQSESFKAALDGSHIKKRLKQYGSSEDIAKQTNLKNILNEIVATANKQGIGVSAKVNADGNIQLGFFDNSRESDYFDADMNPLWDKMAKTTISVVDEDGVLNIGGVQKTNLMFAEDMGGKNGNPVLGAITAQEKMALNLLHTLQRGATGNKEGKPTIADLIKGNESVIPDIAKAESTMKASQARVYTEASSMATYKTAKNEVEGQFRAGGTPEQKMIRASAINMVDFYKSVYKKYTGEDATDKDIEAMHELFALLNKGLVDLVDDSGSDVAKLRQIQGLEQALREQASKLNIVYSGQKEEQFGAGQFNQMGSTSIETFGGLGAPDNRAIDQGYNYLERSSQAIREMETITNVPVIGRVAENNGELSKSANSRTYNLGRINDKLIADIYKQLGLNDSILPSVREGGVLVPESLLRTLDSIRRTPVSMNLNDMDEDFIERYGLRNLNEGEVIDVFENIGLPQKMGRKNGEEKWAEAGEVLQTIRREGDSFVVTLEKQIEAQTSSKIITESGHRGTLQAIPDDVFKEITNILGLNGANALIEDSSIKAKNIAPILRGRLEYIFNEFINKKVNKNAPVEEQEKQRREAIEEIQGVLKRSGTKLAQILTYDEESGLFVENQKLSAQEKEAIYNSAEFLNSFTKDSDTYRISEALMGEEWANDALNHTLIATRINLANEYAYEKPVGNEGKAALEAKHMVKIGDREKKAFLRLGGILRATGRPDLASGLEKNFEQVFSEVSPKREKRIQDAQIIRDSLKQTLGNYTGVANRDYLPVYGRESAGEENAIIVEQLISRMTEWSEGGISDEDYALTPLGLLRQELSARGLDKAVLDLGGDVNLGEIDGELRAINKIVIPILDPDKIGDKNVMGEINKATSDLMRTVANKSDNNYEDKVAEAVRNYLAIMENAIGNKEGEYYKDQHEVALSYSTAGKAIGLNVEQTTSEEGKKRFADSTIITEDVARKMLKSGDDISDEDRASHLERLKAQLKLLGKDISQITLANEQTWLKNKNNMEIYKTVESELIDEIIKSVTLNFGVSAEKQKYLTGFFHRYPSVNGLDEIVTRILVANEGSGIQFSDRGVATDLGLAEVGKLDFDGDTDRLTLGWASGKFDEESFMAAEKGKQELQKITQVVTEKVAKMKKADEEAEQSGIGTPLDVSDIAKLASQRNPLTAIVSKANKKNVGSFSNISTAIRETLYNAGLDERSMTDDVESQKNAVISMLTRGVFESFEQDAISSKKIGERVYQMAEEKMRKAGVTDADITEEALQKVVIGEIDQLLNYLYKGDMGRALSTAQSIGIFNKDGMIESSRMRAALAYAQQIAGPEVLAAVLGGNPNDFKGDLRGLSINDASKVIGKAESLMGGVKVWDGEKSVIKSALYTKMWNPANRSGSVKVTPERGNFGVLLDDSNRPIAAQLEEFVPGVNSNRTRIGLPLGETSTAQVASTLGSALTTEGQSLSLNNINWQNHEEVVQAAVLAEQAKLKISQSLTGQLGKESQALEETEKQAQETAAAVGSVADNFTQYQNKVKLSGVKAIELQRGIDVDKNGNPVDENGNVTTHLYTKDSKERVQSFSTISSYLTGNFGKPEDLAKRKDMLDIVTGKNFTGVLTPQMVGLEEGEFNRLREQELSNERGSVVHKALEVLGRHSKDANFDMENWREYVLNDREFSDVKNDRLDYISKFGLDESFFNLEETMDSYINLFKKAGIQLSEVAEKPLGLEFEGSEGTKRVGFVIDQMAQFLNGAFLNMDYKVAKNLSPAYAMQLTLGSMGLNLGANIDPELAKLVNSDGKIITENGKNYIAQYNPVTQESKLVPYEQITKELIYALISWSDKIAAGEADPLTYEEQQRFMGVPHTNMAVVSESDMARERREAREEFERNNGPRAPISRNLFDLTDFDSAFNEVKSKVEQEPEMDFYQKDKNRVKVFTEALKEQTKALEEAAKAEAKIAQIREQKQKIEGQGNEENQEELTFLNETLKKEERKLEVIKAQWKYAKEKADSTGVRAAITGDNINPDNILDEENAKEARDAITRYNSEARRGVGVGLAQGEAKLELEQEKTDNKNIKDYINNLKKQHDIQIKIQKAQKDLEGTRGDKAKELKAYINSLQSQQAFLAKNAPLLKEQEMSAENLARLEKLRNEESVRFNTEQEKIVATYKKRVSLVDQLVGGFKQTLQNVSVYSIASRMFNQLEQGLRQVVQGTKELDTVLVDIQIASGKTRTETHALMIEYNSLGKELGKTTQEIATASNDWLRAGYDGAEVMELTKASAMLSTLGMIDTANATSYLISTMKGWKLQAEEVMDVVNKLTAVDI